MVAPRDARAGTADGLDDTSAEQLWRLLVTRPGRGEMAPSVAVELFTTHHGDSAPGAVDTALVPCTDWRWRRTSATVLAGLAVQRASDEDIARLRAAAERAGEEADVESASAALVHYFLTLAAISHNPLLAALCRIITLIQVGLAVELSKDSGEEWGAIPRSLNQARLDIVEAIEARDSRRAVQLVRDYHTKVVERIRASPGATKVRDVDPDLTTVLSSWLGTNVGIGNSLDRRT